MTIDPQNNTAPPSEDLPKSSDGWALWAVTRLLIPAGIVGMGLLCMGVLIMSKSSAERSDPTPGVPQVMVTPLEAHALPATIESSGLVTPAQQVQLAAEVQGRIVSQSDKLLPGARFKKGELLAQIDTRNYRAAVAAQERTLKQAELDLALERNRGSVAQREWELLGEPTQVDADLALRKPHLATAQAAHVAAVAALEQAKANLGRTRLVAPFDALVLNETIDVGQVVGPSAPVATLVGTSAFWVQISLPMDRLSAIDIPGVTGAEGSPARVVQRLGQDAVVREGRVRRLMGELDPQTRTAQLIVEIEDPLFGEGLPLLPNAWVDVSIDGKVLQSTWEIPRTALVRGQFAWVVDREQTLRRRTVTIGWRTPESVIVTAGFEPGDQLVVSPLTLPVDGQPVTTTEEAG